MLDTAITKLKSKGYEPKVTIHLYRLSKADVTQIKRTLGSCLDLDWEYVNRDDCSWWAGESTNIRVICFLDKEKGGML